MKISIIGAGYSSLVLAYILKQKNHEKYNTTINDINGRLSFIS